MSKHVQTTKKKITVRTVLNKYRDQEKLAMVTCYDSSFGRLVEASAVDMVLVGDSLGNVMMGYDSTVPVKMQDMIHHSAAVSRVLKTPLLCADMPFLSYHVSVEQAVSNAGSLIQDGGAEAVKLEGGREVVPAIRRIVQAGIPVLGHLGLTPQSIHALGGYQVQGRGDEKAKRLIEDAKALQEAGVFALILELVPAALAEKITAALDIPTIGIGAGVHTSGQVLVLQDLLGFDGQFRPKFLKQYANVGDTISAALASYVADVKSAEFPSQQHSFSE